MLFMTATISNLQNQNYKRMILDYSLALGTKMNVLLFLPGLLLVWNYSFGPVKTIGILVILVLTQVLIGLPFILVDARAYFGKAFEFDRKFLFKWSVNWNFLGEEKATS